MNVEALLSQASKVFAHRTAIQFGERALGYAELEARAQRIAAGLVAKGFAPGDRIVLWMRNRPELVESMFGCFKAGAVVVPLNIRLHPSEVAYIIEDCGASALLHDEDVTVSAALPKMVRRFEASRLPMGEATNLSPVDVGPEDAAWLFYTSGTTGRPKGAILTHRNLVAMSMNCLADIYSFQREDVVLHAAPLTHGSGMYMLPSLARGSTNIIVKGGSFDPTRVLDHVETERVTVIAFLAPTMIVRLIADSSSGKRDLSSLRCVIYGGGPMYVEHLRDALARFGRIWVQIYGQGETPMTGTYLRAADHRQDSPEWERRLGSIGMPRTGIELRIVDDAGENAASQQIGEIVVRGDTVMKGYWGNPSATLETLKGGWLHTGDLGYSDPDGYIYLVDRAKDMIISGGSNVYAREVEEALITHPAVAEVAVIGIPHEAWGEVVHAVVVLRPGQGATAADLINHCRFSLASYKKPQSVEFVYELPKNAYGKVLKRDLRAKHWAGRDRHIGGGEFGPPGRVGTRREDGGFS